MSKPSSSSEEEEERRKEHTYDDDPRRRRRIGFMEQMSSAGNTFFDSFHATSILSCIFRKYAKNESLFNKCRDHYGTGPTLLDG